MRLPQKCMKRGLRHALLAAKKQLYFLILCQQPDYVENSRQSHTLLRPRHARAPRRPRVLLAPSPHTRSNRAGDANRPGTPYDQQWRRDAAWGIRNFKRQFLMPFIALGKVEHTSVPKGEPAGYVPLPLSHAAGLGDNAVRHIAWTNPPRPVGVGRTGTGFLIAKAD
jgi:hypothetical protein